MREQLFTIHEKVSRKFIGQLRIIGINYFWEISSQRELEIRQSGRDPNMTIWCFVIVGFELIISLCI